MCGIRGYISESSRVPRTGSIPRSFSRRGDGLPASIDACALGSRMLDQARVLAGYLEDEAMKPMDTPDRLQEHKRTLSRH